MVEKLNDIPDFFYNKSKIIQVFTNLIVNALQAMDDNGTLTIQTFKKESSESNKEVVIKICDTGKGISEENIAK